MLDGNPPVDATSELDGDRAAITGLALVEVETTVVFFRVERVCRLGVLEADDDSNSEGPLLLVTVVEASSSELESDAGALKEVLTAALE